MVNVCVYFGQSVIQKMLPKSNAEIQQEYRRQRDADPHHRELYLQHEQMKYDNDLSEGKRKLMSAMSEREACQQRCV